MDYNEPELKVASYSKTAKTATLSIKLGDAVLFQKSVKLIAGFNAVDYDYSMDEKAVKSFNKDRETEVKLAENGKYYLPKGEYLLEISTDKEASSQALILK